MKKQERTNSQTAIGLTVFAALSIGCVIGPTGDDDNSSEEPSSNLGSIASTRFDPTPTGCATAEPKFCTSYNEDSRKALGDLTIEATTPDLTDQARQKLAILGKLNEPNSAVCQAYYDQHCSAETCKTIFDLDSCADFDPELAENAGCVDVHASVCPGIYDRSCPQANLSKCDAYEADDAGALAPVACRDHLLTQCDAKCAKQYEAEISPAWCSTPIDSTRRDSSPYPYCDDFIADSCETTCEDTYLLNYSLCADRSQVHPYCSDWQTDVCDIFVASQCLSEPNLTRCFYPETQPEACALHNETVCEGFQEELCPQEQGIAFTAERCIQSSTLSELKLSRHQACGDWVEAECVGVLEEHSRQLAEAEGSCEGKVIWLDDPNAALDFEVKDSWSLPGDFDCVVPEHGELEFDEAFYKNNGMIWSCAEFTFERFYNYRLFKSVIKPFEHDARLIYNTAYSTDPAFEDFALGTRGTTKNNPFGYYPFPNADALGNHNQHVKAAIGELPRDYQLLDSYGSLTESTRLPKNTFARLAQSFYPELRGELRDHSPELSAIVDKITDKQGGVYAKMLDFWPVYSNDTDISRNGWAWHKYMNDELAGQGITDEELEYLKDSRDRFDELIRDYNKQVLPKLEICELLGDFSQGAQNECMSEYRALRDSFIADIEPILLDADQRGCFDLVPNPNSDFEWMPSACDWSPDVFVDHVEFAFERKMARTESVCEEYASDAGKFSDLSNGYIHLHDSDPVPVWRSISGDPRRSAKTFESYLDYMIQTQKLLPKLIQEIPNDTPENRKPKISYGISDSHTLGDDKWFGVVSSYGANFDLHAPLFYGDTTTPFCEYHTNAEAYFDADAKVLTFSLPLIDARVNADTRVRNASGASLKVVGTRIWTYELEDNNEPVMEDGASVFNLTYDFETNEENCDKCSVEKSASATVFSIAGFNVDLKAGISGEVGFRGDATLQYGGDVSDCSGGAHAISTGKAEPFARVDGFAQAGVDFWVAEIGIGGSLNVITVSVPSTFEAQIVLGVSKPEIDAQVMVDVDSTLDLSALSGKLYIYADTWWKTYKKTIFQWSGYSWSWELLDWNFSFNTGSIQSYCDTSGVNCL